MTACAPTTRVHTLDFWQKRPRRLEGGGWASAAEALAHHPDLLARAGAGWLLPCLERLAAGRRVPLAEIIAAYERLFGQSPRIDRFAPPPPHLHPPDATSGPSAAAWSAARGPEYHRDTSCAPGRLAPRQGRSGRCPTTW